jgi:2-phospho-L-lactate/phosphoenolpyruvate guanylyltransferase
LNCWALVPVKARTAGKQRLARVLSKESRATLVTIMLQHVLGVLSECPDIDDVVVMSPDRDGLPDNIRLLPDARSGVNDALDEALQTLHRGGAERVAIVAGDLPFVTREEVTALVKAGRSAGISLAPDRSGSGTNAACVRLPTQFRFHFGSASLARHFAEAVKLGVTPAIVDVPGLAFDVDEPADVDCLRARADVRYTFLA